MAFALLDCVSLSTHLLLCSDMKWGTRKVKPKDIPSGQALIQMLPARLLILIYFCSIFFLEILFTFISPIAYSA